MNAINPELGKELARALAEIKEDDNIRAVVISGTGEAFSSSSDVQQDIAPLSKMGPSEFTRYLQGMMEMYFGIMQINKPAIAAINGYATGAGLDLAMSCDIRIASEKTKIE